ncbi:SDR family oxidoreductase [Paenibacillus chartarius]|uniref:SDR family oxidoreductase n=1 Tax=Paenibacillus chartarius TaxID=747481 RepID=A0ABV6DV37_9BACL
MYPMYPYYGMETECKEQPLTFPPQHQPQQPGIQSEMVPRPITDNPEYRGSGKLQGKTALITGGDSGIGEAAAIAFAKEGANVSFAYLNEHGDAQATLNRLSALGVKAMAFAADLRSSEACRDVVRRTVESFGKLDVLVNNHAVQFPQPSLLHISEQQLVDTFYTNIISYFFLAQAALPHIPPGGAIVNTASVVAYGGHKELLDYSSTKGAVVSFTRSLALSLADRRIRVNAVAPGPVWTPLIPSSFSAAEVQKFGADTPMKRAAQPFELAPAYVYLASDDSRYVTGETIHVNGGQMVTG